MSDFDKSEIIYSGWIYKIRFIISFAKCKPFIFAKARYSLEIVTKEWILQSST